LNKLFMIHGWCVSPADAAFLDQAREELQPLLTYLPAREDQAKVETALQVAYHAHLGQVRRSGEPFVRHPIEVAKILCELGMDADSVAAGLLHDTVEDTPVSVADIQAVFGAAVRRLVEGETKVSKLPKRLSRSAGSAVAAAVSSGTEGGEGALAPPMTDDQLANLLHLLMAMAQDFRVLVVKLADRLHNMRTLGFMSPAKQIKIARETLVRYFSLSSFLIFG
jgi:GTP pyrophosphokinase